MPMVAEGLGKLLEESGELIEVAAEKLAGWLTDVRPAGHAALSTRMQEELADVRAASTLVTEALRLDAGAIAGHAALIRRGQPGPSESVRHLIETCGALVQVAGKKLAYFHTDAHPDGKGGMSARLEAAIGSVRAASAAVITKLGLDEDAIAERAATKLRLFRTWHAVTDNNQHGVDRALDRDRDPRTNR